MPVAFLGDVSFGSLRIKRKYLRTARRLGWKADTRRRRSACVAVVFQSELVMLVEGDIAKKYKGENLPRCCHRYREI